MTRDELNKLIMEYGKNDGIYDCDFMPASRRLEIMAEFDRLNALNAERLEALIIAEPILSAAVPEGPEAKLVWNKTIAIIEADPTPPPPPGVLDAPKTQNTLRTQG